MILLLKYSTEKVDIGMKEFSVSLASPFSPLRRIEIRENRE